MIWVEFATVGRDVVDYAVVLLLVDGERVETVRLFDGAHRINEMHRFTRDGGKQGATEFHHGTLGEGRRTALAEVKRNHRDIIEGWEER